MRFSLRSLLGVVAVVSVMLAVYELTAGPYYAAGGCALATLAVLIPAMLAAGVATTSGYRRAAMIGGLVPSLLAASFFVAGLAISNGQTMGHEWTWFWPVIARMVYYKHALLLLWSLVPVCLLAGIVAHWLLRND